jgi:hypothetical protein
LFDNNTVTPEVTKKLFLDMGDKQFPDIKNRDSIQLLELLALSFPNVIGKELIDSYK